MAQTAKKPKNPPVKKPKIKPKDFDRLPDYEMSDEPKRNFII